MKRRSSSHFPPGFFGRFKPHRLEALYRCAKRDRFFRHPKAMIELRDAVEIVREVANHQAAEPSQIRDELIHDLPADVVRGK